MMDGLLLIVAAVLSSSLAAVLSFTIVPYLVLMALMVITIISGPYVGTRLRHKVPEQRFIQVFKFLISLLSVRMIVKALIPL